MDAIEKIRKLKNDGYYKFKDTDTIYMLSPALISNELKILEDLYYYSYNESNYIFELKNALKNEGFSLSEDKEKRHLKLKDSFKESNFYKRGKIFINKREDNGTVNINSFPEELDESIQNFHYELRSGKIEVLKGLSEDDINNDFSE